MAKARLTALSPATGPRYLAGDMKKHNTVKDIFGREATWQDSSPQNLEWWAEREAINFIGDFRGYYLRLQAAWDHPQPPESESDIPTYHHPEGWPGGGPPGGITSILQTS
jgi:hypothetical protein